MSRGFSKALLITVILAVAVGGTLTMVKLKPEPAKKEIDNRDPLVEVLTLEPLTTQFEVRSQGTVRPRTETVLSSEITGTITSISAKFIAGGVFSAGETLLRIDPTNYEVALEQAEALVRQRQIEFDGAQKLREQGYRAEAELASAAAALASARAELVRAKRDLQRTYIRLPYDGVVRSKGTDLGQFVSPGTRLGVVFSTEDAEVRLPLTDLDLAFVAIPDAGDVAASGSAAGPAVTLSAIRRGVRHEWDARIVRSEGVVDETSRVTYAVAEILDPYRLAAEGEPLPVGTFVSATIQGREVENVIRVPRIIIRGSNELLFVDDENRIRIRPVEILRSDAEYAYIRGGASPGERVVVTALETPFNGMAVRTADDDDDGEAQRLASHEDED